MSAYIGVLKPPLFAVTEADKDPGHDLADEGPLQRLRVDGLGEQARTHSIDTGPS